MPNIIITGGPGSGKSTLLDALQKAGFYGQQEVSRQLIREQVALGTTCVPWEDLSCFASLALEKMVNDYKSNARQNQVVFFDRGIPDIIAYLKVAGLPVDQQFYDAADRIRYAKQIFMAPPWKEIYINDNERWQTFEEASILHEALFSVYESLKYDIKLIPLASVKERTEFIINSLQITGLDI